MKTKIFTLILLLFLLPVVISAQDVSTPYSRGAQKRALTAIGKQTVALFPMSRYAYVDGYKIRLSDRDILRGEAFSQEGKIYIPTSFAGVLTLKTINPKPIPSGLEVLKDRWVYELDRPLVVIPQDVPRKTVNGEEYFSVTDYAKYLKMSIYTDPSGLVLVSRNPILYKGGDQVVADCITTLFDTPEKYMNPDIATQYIPYLNKQGSWTVHAKITPEQLDLINNGTEKEWNVVPRSDYDLRGFNSALLGSKVPATGVYPRLLFSPEDIPVLRKHIYDNASSMKSVVEMEYLLGKSWLDPSSSDGQIFDMLAKGDLEAIRAKMEQPKEGAAVYHVARLTTDHVPGIFNTHINYVTNCLTTMSFYAIITGNDALGKKCADAIVTYFKLYEPNVEQHLATSDSEFGVDFDGASHSSTHWRGMHGVIPHMDMAFALDFAGKWMNADQKRFMQNLIAKATYGRRTGGGDGPRRAWRDINHVTWHLTHLLSLAAIEGMPGFDAEGYESGAELTRDFLDWGIDKNGQIFESNGKTGGGNQFQLLSMVVLARRGDNLWGHPHFKKLLEAQVQITTPNGERTLTSGSWSGGPLDSKTVEMIKAFYPDNIFADYILTNALSNFDPAKFNADKYRESLKKNPPEKMRLTGPTYPAIDDIFAFPYIQDWKVTKRSDLDLKLNWDTDEYGMFTSSSDKTTDAVWAALQVRSNHYIGAGHHHSDIGMFYFSGLGVNWFAESPFQMEYASKYHNPVLIDGVGESDKSPAKGDYIGSNMMPLGAFGSADLTYAYNWKWCTQVNDDWGVNFSTVAPGKEYRDGMYELETRPEILDIFRGTGHYKMRPWWATSNQSNFIATLRTPWNPVQYVYRNIGVVKGARSYGIITDDLRKDDASHKYQWTGAFGNGVWAADQVSPYPNAVLLAYDKNIEGNSLGNSSAKKLDPIKPVKGMPMLLVYLAGGGGDEKLSVEITPDAPVARNGSAQYYARLSIEKEAVKANYRLIMIPLRYGEKFPQITENGSAVQIKWDNQTDMVEFLDAVDNRTRVVVKRDNNVVILSK